MFKYRPERHITPKKGWINDPNGFAWFAGRFHLYAQHYPYDTQWGPMHWLHFSSDDLIHWKEEGIALKPDQPYDDEFGCFSGSAIEKDGKLYVLYTGCSHGKQTQCLAVSEDGYAFSKYEGNPVIGEKELPEGYLIADFRDPKVFFRDGKYYVLLVSRHKDGYSSILLYSSPDLLHYEFVGVVKELHNCQEGGMVECPDILSYGDKDVLLYSLQHPESKDGEFENAFCVAYAVGKLDLKTGKFLQEGEEKLLDRGWDCYATHSLQKDGKSYLVYWEAAWDSKYPSKKEGYAGQLSLIKEAELVDGELRLSFLEDHPKLTITPEKETARVRLGDIQLTIDRKARTIRITKLHRREGRTIHLRDVSTIRLEYDFDHSCVELRFQGGEAFASIANYKGKPPKEGHLKTHGCITSGG